MKAIIQRKKDYLVFCEPKLKVAEETEALERKRAREDIPSDTEAPTPPKNKKKKESQQKLQQQHISRTPNFNTSEARDEQLLVAPKITSNGNPNLDIT